MKSKILLLLVVLALALTACGTRGSPTYDYAEEMPGYGGAPELDSGMNAPAPQMEYADDSFKSETEGISNATSATNTERLVIKNADVTVVIPDPQVKLDAIAAMADTMGGFVVSSNIYQTYSYSGEEVLEGYISIRVPAEKLNAALTQIKADAVEVRSETQSGQDVTATYVDLQSQLTNLEQAERDLQDIMEEAKNNPNSTTTSKTQDVLTVYNQLVSIRGQIEQIKGQMKYYEEASAYSLINVTLIAEETVKPIEIGGWKLVGEIRDAAQALVRFLQGFATFLVFLVVLVLPMMLLIFGPIALITWGIIALVRRNKAKKSRKAQAA